MQKLATSAGFANWHDARQVIEEVAEAISQFTYLAQQQGTVKQQCLRLLRHWISANRKMQRFFNESKTNFSIHNKYKVYRLLPIKSLCVDLQPLHSPVR